MAHDSPLSARVGLCASCSHVRVVRSDRGSIFYQCKLAATNPRFSQYPILPMLECGGYEADVRPAPPADSEDSKS
ncbi:MAG TPA: hypothetical protein VKV95_13655 [Terriglobia bacterium]|nr:hypothetical protein [Terriglobia bacterium]